MHAKYAVPISYGSKVIAKVKVDNRQTDKPADRHVYKQTDRQDKTNMPPIIRYGGIKRPIEYILISIYNILYASAIAICYLGLKYIFLFSLGNKMQQAMFLTWLDITSVVATTTKRSHYNNYCLSRVKDRSKTQTIM